MLSLQLATPFLPPPACPDGGLQSDEASSGAYAATLVEARSLLRQRGALVVAETAWRVRPAGTIETASGPRIAASRWHSVEDGCRVEERCREADAVTPDDTHVVEIVLRTMNMRLGIAGRVVHDGVATPGMLHVTEPGVTARGLFRGAYDTLHLHVPKALVAECHRDMDERVTIPSQPALTLDPTIERLGRSIVNADQLGSAFGPLYVDSISIAIVARLLSSGRGADRRHPCGLPKWRLKRVIDYIEARLGETVSLVDMATAAGLTRMHFAAQFRASTGLRPHEYLLRRRIERAQEMLLVAGLPLVDVALAVGFQTQSHFTTIFSRFVGQTPHAWREARAGRGRTAQA
jgi:AraC family transcriptional regulator